MTNIPSLCTALQGILSDTANQLARRSGLIQRQRKLTGALFAQSLTFAWLSDDNASLEQLAQTAATLGLTISPQALDERFTPSAAAFFRQLLACATAEAVQGCHLETDLIRRFNGVHLLDSSTVNLPAHLDLPPELEARWPGCGGATAETGRAALKLEVMLDLSDGHLDGPHLMPGRRHDQSGALAQATPERGALRIADLGYFSLERFQHLHASGSFWLTRLKQSCLLFDGASEYGDPFDLLCWLEAAEDAGVHELEREVLLGKRHRLACRLLAQRVPERVAAERRRKLRRRMQKHGRMPSKRRLRLCAWTLLVTNVPKERLSLGEALSLMRARWQLELLFKQWKQHGGVGKSRSGNVWRYLCEVYAKLLAMLIQHWVLVVGLWHVKARSLVKGSRTVRGHAQHVAASMGSPRRLRWAIETVVLALGRGCRINARRRHPNTYQILMQPTLCALT